MQEIHIRLRLRRTGRAQVAVLAASGLLAMCLALAGSLVWSRGLADPVEVRGWAITFRPPRGWEREETTPDRWRTTISYREPARRGYARQFSITRRPARPDRSPEELCFDEVRQLVGSVHSLRLLASFGRPRRLCPRRPAAQAGGSQ
jgi:hypothetical protein